MTEQNWMPLNEDEEALLEQLQYMRKKRKIDVLNKAKVTKNDLDEVFNE